MVNEGDQICRLIPDGVATQRQDEPAGRPAAASAERATSDEKQLPSPSTPPRAASGSTQAVTMTQSLMSTFGPVSDLTRRLRESREKIKSREKDLERRKAGLAEATKEQSEIEAEIDGAEEQANSDDPEKSRQAKEDLNQLRQKLPAIENRRESIFAAQSAARRDLEEIKKYLADAEAERATILKLLQSQLLAAERQFDLQSKRLDMRRNRFIRRNKPRSDFAFNRGRLGNR